MKEQKEEYSFDLLKRELGECSPDTIFLFCFVLGEDIRVRAKEADIAVVLSNDPFELASSANDLGLGYKTMLEIIKDLKNLKQVKA